MTTENKNALLIVDAAEKSRLPLYEGKAQYFAGHQNTKDRKRWYYRHYPIYHRRYVIRKIIGRLISLRLPLYVSFLRWLLVDFLRAKQTRFMGIYLYVGMPGEGKTLSMVAHIRRAKAAHPDLVVATNFHFLYEDVQITHWTDIINVALDAHKRKRPCLVAVDEIQNTFDATDYKNFPVALYTLLTFNRKLELQFLCSSQIYDRTPSKIRALANYVVICKNVGKRDRLFRNYYFEKNNYESVFEGSRKKADFLRQYIADDELYASYDTFEQVQAVKGKAEDEKAMREYAMGLIFGGGDDADDAGGAAVHR